MGYLGNFRREGVEVTMYKCICGADLKYLNSEDDGELIIEFYECDNCKKIIAVSDIEEE